MTPEEIAKEIFYKPASNGRADQSLKEGAELIRKALEMKDSEHLERLKEIRSSILQLLLHNGFTDETLVSLPGALEILDKAINDKK